MNRYSLKTLFLFVATAGVLIAVATWSIETIRQHRFVDRIAAEWGLAPVVSSAILVDEKNDIEFEIRDGNLTLLSTGRLVPLNKPNDLIVEVFDFDFDGGQFRVIFYDNNLSKLTSRVDAEKPAFNVFLDAITLNVSSHYTTEPLWKIRSEIAHGWCKSRFQHFENSSKKGIIVGRIDDCPNSVMYVFDSSGEYAVAILPIATNATQWEELADGIILKRKPESADINALNRSR